MKVCNADDKIGLNARKFYAGYTTRLYPIQPAQQHRPVRKFEFFDAEVSIYTFQKANSLCTYDDETTRMRRLVYTFMVRSRGYNTF